MVCWRALLWGASEWSKSSPQRLEFCFHLGGCSWRWTRAWAKNVPHRPHVKSFAKAHTGISRWQGVPPLGPTIRCQLKDGKGGTPVIRARWEAGRGLLKPPVQAQPSSAARVHLRRTETEGLASCMALLEGGAKSRRWCHVCHWGHFLQGEQGDYRTLVSSCLLFPVLS